MPASPEIMVKTADERLHALVTEMVKGQGLMPIARYRPGVVYLVVDSPPGWTLAAVAGLTQSERRYVVVSTQLQHPVYWDCLMSYQISGVFFHTDAERAMATLSAAAIGAVSTTMTSGLTPN